MYYKSLLSLPVSFSRTLLRYVLKFQTGSGVLDWLISWIYVELKGFEREGLGFPGLEGRGASKSWVDEGSLLECDCSFAS